MNDFSAAKSWPFEEARKLAERFKSAPPAKGYVLFETGYGPSGLPHIGTFGEVARTLFVRHAFRQISDIPTRLFAFSDDMDGLRKVPDNVPNKEMVEKHLGVPLTSIPDPFGTHESYGHNMNSRLRAFLDEFGFEYEFKSSTECYKSGLFDAALLKVLENYDSITNLILPALGEERRQTYSPFLPVCPETGKVLHVAVTGRDPEAGTITYKNESGKEVETPVTGGRCKLQWRPDWAMRWLALSVDYEMYGKDLISSAELAQGVCRILGGKPPEGFFYELFLDENGEKISKSRGNGLTINEWLRYAPHESLSLYMFNSPRKAKRLYFDVIPKNVDEYLTWVKKYAQENGVDNPAWHIHSGTPPKPEGDLNFSLLLNLASACNPEDKSVLWGFISNYNANVTPENSPFLDRLAEYAVNYYKDFVKTAKEYRAATEEEAKAMSALITALKALPAHATAEEIQTHVYEIGKSHGFEDLKLWFQALYEVLLGQKQGPRMGSFFALYGISKSVELIEKALEGELASA